MNIDGPMTYHPVAMADMSTTITALGRELDDIGQRAVHLLQQSADYFQGPSGATNYAQAMKLVTDCIDEGHQILTNQGQVVTNVADNFVHHDMVVGNGFQSI